MKSKLFASAAILASLLAAPAFAQATGFIGANWTNTKLEASAAGVTEDVDGDGVGLEASLAFGAEEGWGTQFDVNWADADDSDAFGGKAHLLNRSGALAYGAFLGFSNVADSRSWTAGVEAQTFMDAFTIGGALAYNNFEDEAKGLGASGEVRFYPSDDLRLSAGVSYDALDFDDEDADLVSLGVGAEFRLPGSPFSIYGTYSRSETDLEMLGVDVDVKADVFMVGARFNFGSGTLKARDRSGPAFVSTTGAMGAASLVGAMSNIDF